MQTDIRSVPWLESVPGVPTTLSNSLSQVSGNPGPRAVPFVD
jgi:hypothetical protein